MKHLIAALTLILTLAMPQLSSAAPKGIYITPKALFSMMGHTTNADAKGAGKSWVDTSNSYNQFTLGGGLAVGYDWYPSSKLPIRTELEVIFRGNSTDTFDAEGGLNTQLHADKGENAELKGTWNTTTLFANIYYDFHNSTDFTPYIGGGIGLAFNYVGYSMTAGNRYMGYDEKYSTNFAWNIGAGCSYAFNETVSLDLGYRYVSAGTTSIDGTFNGVHYDVDSFAGGHEVTLGLRFTF